MAEPLNDAVGKSAPSDGARESTWEELLLEVLPEVREIARSSPEFEQWKSKIRRVTVDGELFYVRGGDMLRDESQILFDWAWETGLITQETAERAEKAISKSNI